MNIYVHEVMKMRMLSWILIDADISCMVLLLANEWLCLLILFMSSVMVSDSCWF